ncbi:cellulose biosynthesis cyclic di-GMP-binding regulatory protein BcsB [Azospirillum sp. ST 5-10]|uniref:cellulose biosynthesis cyclic di-GMP-binding regulatory protein BcsB n=1 Tax=unclassified Azospirillum TaxID=2630922 RepID=UPI003F49E547
MRPAFALILALLAAALAAAGPARAEQRVIPLSNLHDGLERVELSGETDAATLVLVLPPTAPLTQVVLSLVYENGIDVLPERSHLLVGVNGDTVAELPMAAIRGPVTASITLPVEHLRAGANRFTVRQEAQHRVFCNVRGTFDLWSRIDLARSTLRLDSDGAPPAPTLSMLPDLFAASDRAAVPLTIVRSGGTARTDHLGWAAIVAQAYGRALGAKVPRVESWDAAARPDGGAPADPLPAKSVVVGTRNDLAGIVAAPILQQVTGPFLGVFAVPGDPGGFTVVASGRTAAEVDRAVVRLYRTDRPLPSRPTMVVDEAAADPAASPAAADLRQGRYRLRELGLETATHGGYRFRRSFELPLPSDFQAIADSTAVLRLDASFDGELGPAAVVNVLINDRVAGSLGLAERSGNELRHAEINLPMSAFRPGPNRVEIVAELAPDREVDCAYAVRRPVFTLYGSSELEVPAFARLAFVPDLGLTARTGFPLAAGRGDRDGRTRPFDLVVAGDGEGWTGAALTLLARLGQRAGTLLWPVPHVGWVQPTERSALVVGPVGQLPQAALRNDNVTPDWLSRVLEAGTRLTQLASADPGFPEEAQRRVAERLLRLAGKDVDAERDTPAPSGRLAEGTGAASRWARPDSGEPDAAEPSSWRTLLLDLLAPVRRFTVAFMDHVGNDAPTLLDIDGVLPDAALLQIAGPDSSRRVWTVLTGTDGATLERAAARLVAEPSWSEVDGSTALWRSTSGAMRIAHPTSIYATIDDWWDVRNLFLILANLLSQRIGMLFIILLATVLTLAFALHALLRRGRRL